MADPKQLLDEALMALDLADSQMEVAHGKVEEALIALDQTAARGRTAS